MFWGIDYLGGGFKHFSSSRQNTSTEIYKNYVFSKLDHTTMRKKTHQNELDGWKHDGWALASG